MTINEKIKGKKQKLQSDINREEAKISELISGKIDKDGYLTGKELLLSGPSQIMKPAKFTYTSLWKAFEK